MTTTAFSRRVLLASTAISLAAALPVAAQTPANQPQLTQVINCVKILPGKRAEYRQFISEVTAKMMKTRIDAGRMLTWTALRSVMPAGSEARCDYMTSSFFEGPPPPPATREDTEKALQAAGLHMTSAEYVAKRDSLLLLVSTEMWRPRIRLGAAAKGHYVFLNYMKVHEPAEYHDFEQSTWRPMAELRVKDGSMSGWIFASKMLPAGTDTVYSAYSADIYPTWDAVFKPGGAQASFEKVHPGRNYQQAMTRLAKLRDLARRELFVVEERLSRQ